MKNNEEVKLVVYGKKGNPYYYDASIKFRSWVEWVREGIHFTNLPEELRAFMEDAEIIIPLNEHLPGNQIVEVEIRIRAIEEPTLEKLEDQAISEQ